MMNEKKELENKMELVAMMLRKFAVEEENEEVGAALIGAAGWVETALRKDLNIEKLYSRMTFGL